MGFLFPCGYGGIFYGKESNRSVSWEQRVRGLGNPRNELRPQRLDTTVLSVGLRCCYNIAHLKTTIINTIVLQAFV